jgi:hypothetical protein
MRRQSSNDSWDIPLLGIVLFLAILFYHWRENKQEAVIIDIKKTVDENKEDVRAMKESFVQAEVKPQPPPKPRRVKVKPKPKRISQDFANGDYSKDN